MESANNKKTLVYGFIGVALAVAAYLFLGRGKAKPTKTSSSEADVLDEGVGSDVGGGDKGDGGKTDVYGFTWNASCNRYNGNTAFAIKVKQVQREIGIMGCDVDGLVGGQTNGLIATKYPKTYRVYGGLTEANIDQYLGGKYEKSQSGGAMGDNVVIGDITYVWNSECKRYNGADEFSKKVKTVQSEIGLSGCELDGLVGNITNNTLKSKYPKTFAKFGGLTSSNISEYLGGKYEKTA